jgi:hypothetical protein
MACIHTGDAQVLEGVEAIPTLTSATRPSCCRHSPDA